MTLTISIDMGMACSSCGEKGATQNGLCLKCIAKRAREGRTMQVGPKVIEAMKLLCAEVIDTHAAKINQAWLKSETGKLPVGIKVSLSPHETLAETMDVKVTISYSLEKVSYEVSKAVSDTQGELPLGKG